MPFGVPTQRSINLGPGSVEQIDVAPTDFEVVNSAAVTVVYSFALVANALGTNRALRTTIVGDYFNNSGVPRSINLRMRLGGVTLYQSNFPIVDLIADAAVRRSMWIHFCVANRDSAALQISGGYVMIGSSAQVPAVGFGPVSETMTNAFGGPLTGIQTAIDTTQTQTFDVSVEHSIANANVSFRRRLAYTDIAHVT